MDKILYTKFENIGDILQEFKKKLGPRKQSKITTLFLTWREIVGNKMAEVSRPVGLSKEKILFVTCKNSLITQGSVLLAQRGVFAKLPENRKGEAYVLSDKRHPYRGGKG